MQTMPFKLADCTHTQKKKKTKKNKKKKTKKKKTTKLRLIRDIPKCFSGISDDAVQTFDLKLTVAML